MGVPYIDYTVLVADSSVGHVCVTLMYDLWTWPALNVDG